jgi:hypothetical protein
MRMSTLSIVLGCVAAVAQAQAPEDAPPKEPTSQASAILRVTSDPASGLSNEDLLARLIMSVPTYREALNLLSKGGELAPLPPLSEFNISAMTWDMYNHAEKRPDLRSDLSAGVGLVWVNVSSYDKRVDAAKLLAAVGATLENRLRELDTDHASQQARMDAQAHQMEKLALTLEKEHQTLGMLASIHKVEIDPALGAQKRLRIETEATSLDAQLQGLKARQAVIEKQIALLGEVSATSGDPEIVRQLVRSIEARKKIVQFQTAASEAGNVRGSIESLEKAKDELAQAEADLARYRRTAADAAAGGRIAQLKQRLDDTAIEIAETEARREALGKQFEAAAGRSNQVEMKRIALEVLEHEYRREAEELSNLRSDLRRYVSPQVTVIGLQ